MTAATESATGPATGAAATGALSRRRLLGYGVGSVGTGVFSAVPGLLLLFFMTDTLAVPAALAGVVVVVPKALDVFANPVIGAASDRDAVRTGHRRRLLLTGAAALPVAFALMFTSPLVGAGAAAWIAATFVAASLLFACFQVPYVALPAEMSPDPAQRLRIMVWRIVFLTAGILVAGGLAPVVVEAAGQGRRGHAVMGAVVGAVVLAACLTAALSSRWVRSAPGPQPLGLVAALRTGRGNRPFFALLTAFVLQAVGVAVALAAAPYVATYWLGDYGLTAVLFACLVAPSAAAVPLWAAAARRFGRERCYAAATAGFAAAAVAAYPAAHAGAVPATLALAAVLGLCYAGLQVLPLAMMPDTVHSDAARTGHAQAGAFTGLWTAGETAGLAVGPGVYAMLLAASGFAASTFDAPVRQTDAAREALLLGFTAVPAMLMALSLPAIRAFHRRYATASTLSDITTSAPTAPTAPAVGAHD